MVVKCMVIGRGWEKFYGDVVRMEPCHSLVWYTVPVPVPSHRHCVIYCSPSISLNMAGNFQ